MYPGLFYVLWTVRPGMVLANNQLDTQLLMYVYFCSLHVSGSYLSIIRRNNCVGTSFGVCHCVQMTVWCAGAYAPAYHTATYTE